MSKPVDRLAAILSIVVLVGAAAAAAASDEKEVLMARCRATCALRHLPRGAATDADAADAAKIKEVTADSLDERCGKKADCQMCWKTCAMIFVRVNVWGSMCRMPKRFCVSF